ncbi:MAG: rod shape-determining protein MreC [Phycisphaerales bacterium]
MHHQPAIVRWSMPITIVTLFVLSLAPIRMIGWTNWFAAQAQVAVAPIAHPITIAINTVIPPAISDPEASLRERALGDELNRVRTDLLQTKEENARLSNLVKELSRGSQLTPNLAVRQIHRPRISSLVGDHILIRSGSIEGLTRGSVVVVDAVQLLGKVTRVEAKTCTVLPITARSSGQIQAAVLLDDQENHPAMSEGNGLGDDQGVKRAICLLTPLGDGTLRGEVAGTAGDANTSIKIGQEVRLLDSQWPRHAQMLLIGTVQRIERNDAQPLRQRIIVEPSVKDLRRVPEVIFRLPALDEDDGRDGDDQGGAP